MAKSSAEKRVVQIGPFQKGLNNFSDPSAIPDDALAELLNMELDLDGSLVSRPPFTNMGVNMPLGTQGDMQLLGFYYTPQGAEYLIASDGVTSTYYLSGGAWNLLTGTFAATAMTQFDDKAWLLASVGSANPGGTWTPSDGFKAEANMPRGTIIVSFKFRLWIAQGEQSTSNGSRLYFSKILGVTPFWPTSADFIDIARGDGQSIVAIRRYYESLLIFRTSSIYRFQYTSDPANGIIEVSVPNIGLDSRHSLEEYENYFYFMYDDRAFEYMNGRALDISQAISFEAGARSGYVWPRAVSIFQQRVLFSFFGTLYAFSLITRTWSKWQMPSIGGVSKVLERRSDDLTPPNAVAMPALSQAPKDIRNLALRGSFELFSGESEEVARNLILNPSGTQEVEGTERWYVGNLGGGKATQTYGEDGFTAVFTTSAATTAMSLQCGGPGGRTPIEGGKQYVASMEIITSHNDARTIRLQWYNAAGSNVGDSLAAPRTVLPANTPVRLEVTAMAPATAVGASIVIFQGFEGPAPSRYVAGRKATIRKALLRQMDGASPVIGEYFDGGFPTSGQLVFTWEGEPNKSPSIKTSLGGEVEGVVPAPETSPLSDISWSASGARSLLVSSTGESVDTYVDYEVNGLSPGRTYTVAVQQRVAVNEDIETSNKAAQMEVLNVLSSTVIDAGDISSGERTVRSTFISETESAQVRLHGGVALGDGAINWDDLSVVQGELPTLEPFSGLSEDSSTRLFFWEDVVGDSVSIQRNLERESPLYQISDVVGAEVEPFECLVRTKVFNYDESAKYKRLFWWGIDAIFRKTVKGTVVPITYGGQVTWGELLQHSWKDLLRGTWGQPTAKGLSVETIRPDLGATAQRKFSKFKKGLRFRQLQFEVLFDTDGSSSSAPVRLFSIHTEVTQAQTVSKAIT